MEEGTSLATKTNRLSMTDALKGRDDVIAFLEAGKPSTRNNELVNKTTDSEKPPEERIAVTLRLPKEVAHALIDASAQRRKNRAKAWSQQDIVAEVLVAWLRQTLDEGPF